MRRPRIRNSVMDRVQLINMDPEHEEAMCHQDDDGLHTTAEEMSVTQQERNTEQERRSR